MKNRRALIPALGAAVVFAALSPATQAATKAKDSYSKAHDACMAKANSTLDMVGCNSAELAARDKALNAAYARALDRVSEAAAPFKAAERAWIAYRNADCSVYEDREQFGTLGEVEGGDCMIDRTIERTKALDAFAQY